MGEGGGRGDIRLAVLFYTFGAKFFFSTFGGILYVNDQCNFLFDFIHVMEAEMRRREG